MILFCYSSRGSDARILFLYRFTKKSLTYTANSWRRWQRDDLCNNKETRQSVVSSCTKILVYSFLFLLFNKLLLVLSFNKPLSVLSFFCHSVNTVEWFAIHEEPKYLPVVSLTTSLSSQRVPFLLASMVCSALFCTSFSNLYVFCYSLSKQFCCYTWYVYRFSLKISPLSLLLYLLAEIPIGIDTCKSN